MRTVYLGAGIPEAERLAPLGPRGYLVIGLIDPAEIVDGDELSTFELIQRCEALQARAVLDTYGLDDDAVCSLAHSGIEICDP